MTTEEISRRKFLHIAVAILSTGITPIALSQERVTTGMYNENDPELTVLRRMGEEYTVDFPEDNSGRDQIEKILGDAELSAEEIINQLRILVRDDYEMERLVNLSGWNLSLTEARVMAVI